MDEKDLLNHLKITLNQTLCEHDWQGKANQVCSLCGLKRNITHLIINDGSFIGAKKKEHKHRFVRIGKHQQVCKDCGKKEKL